MIGNPLGNAAEYYFLTSFQITVSKLIRDRPTFPDKAYISNRIF